jgi:hypothetical protein
MRANTAKSGAKRGDRLAARGGLVNLDDIGNLAELIAAIGVMISLIYLAIQIRRSSETERMATYRAIVSDFGSLNQSIASDPELALLFAQGLESYGELNEAEKARLSQYFYSVFRYFENMFYQHDKGYLEQSVWQGWARMMLTYFNRPGFQVWWRQRRLVFDPSFVRYLETTKPDVELISYFALANPESTTAPQNS